MTLGALETLEQVLADSISADSVIGGNPSTQVHVDPQKNIVATVTNKIAKLGTLIVPYVAKATDDSSGIEGVYYDDVPFTVGVFQNPKLVTSGLTARAIAERIAAILKGNSGWPRNIALGNPTIEHIADSVLNIYQVNGRTAADGGILDPIAAPIIALNGNNPGDQVGVTISCATLGAAIFYRTDGNAPTTGDTFFNGDFIAPHGAVIVARAWLQGWLASPYVQFTVP